MLTGDAPKALSEATAYRLLGHRRILTSGGIWSSAPKFIKYFIKAATGIIPALFCAGAITGQRTPLIFPCFVS